MRYIMAANCQLLTYILFYYKLAGFVCVLSITSADGYKLFNGEMRHGYVTLGASVVISKEFAIFPCKNAADF